MYVKYDCFEIIFETIALLCIGLKKNCFLCFQFQTFQENYTVYLGLEKHITETNFKKQLNISAENDSRRLHCMLRDLSSLLQALGRLVDHFIGEHFTANMSDAHMLVEK